MCEARFALSSIARPRAIAPTPASRRQLHGQIARTLEVRFADIVASQPEIVAHHFTQAGLVEPAIDYWLNAGNLALSRSANAEAVKHLRDRADAIKQDQPVILRLMLFPEQVPQNKSN